MQRFNEATRKTYIICKNLVKTAYNLCKLITKKTVAIIDFFCRKVITCSIKHTTLFLKKSPRILAAIITVILVLSCAATVVAATGATSAYSVVYNGNVIATVKNPSVLAEAKNLAAIKLNNPICNSQIINVSLTNTFVSEKNLLSSNDLAEVIIDHSENIVTATVLKLDGEAVAIGEGTEPINSFLSEYLTTFGKENGLEQVEFVNELEAQNIYTIKAEVEKLPCVENYLEANKSFLSVQSITTITETEEIPFETVEIETEKLSAGTKKTVSKGVNGTKNVTYKVYSLNGTETKRVEISSTVVTEPVNQEVLVGTKRIIAADKNGTAPMAWPVKRVEGLYVSSYVGDGRGHKGMDICAPSGTPIYAAESGTVTFAGWDSSGYGYKVVIEHTGSLKTLYAHCKELYVKVGDVVARGENIASVGSTGRSTGNHLHFEVHKNGKFTNPSDYIGRD